MAQQNGAGEAIRDQMRALDAVGKMEDVREVGNSSGPDAGAEESDFAQFDENPAALKTYLEEREKSKSKRKSDKAVSLEEKEEEEPEKPEAPEEKEEEAPEEKPEPEEEEKPEPKPEEEEEPAPGKKPEAKKGKIDPNSKITLPDGKVITYKEFEKLKNAQAELVRKNAEWERKKGEAALQAEMRAAEAEKAKHRRPADPRDAYPKERILEAIIEQKSLGTEEGEAMAGELTKYLETRKLKEEVRQEVEAEFKDPYKERKVRAQYQEVLEKEFPDLCLPDRMDSELNKTFMSLAYDKKFGALLKAHPSNYILMAHGAKILLERNQFASKNTALSAEVEKLKKENAGLKQKTNVGGTSGGGRGKPAGDDGSTLNGKRGHDFFRSKLVTADEET